MKRNIKEHFEERLMERTDYNLETLAYDIERRKDEVLLLSKDSKELDWFPHLKREFKKYPNSTLMVYESLGICMVTSNRNLITIYNL